MARELHSWSLQFFHFCLFAFGYIMMMWQECTILLIHGRRAAYFASPYVDSYGERHRSIRGRPLFLDKKRYAVVRGLWVNHLVAHEVREGRLCRAQPLLFYFWWDVQTLLLLRLLLFCFRLFCSFFVLFCVFSSCSFLFFFCFLGACSFFARASCAISTRVWSQHSSRLRCDDYSTYAARTTLSTTIDLLLSCCVLYYDKWRLSCRHITVTLYSTVHKCIE